MRMAAIADDEIGTLNFAPRRKEGFVIGTKKLRVTR
jgi:hypothetical protein